MEHLDIVSKGADAIFYWRLTNSTSKLSLGGAALGKAKLAGADISGADLRKAILIGADLSGASLRGADLRGAKIGGANLCGADLRGAKLGGADLSGAVLSGAYLSDAELSRVNLTNANLSDANLNWADIGGANLSGAKMCKADVSHADMGDANLSYADLSGAIIRNCDLSGANLSHASLCDADLSEANLNWANLCDANLRGARLYWARLIKTELLNANVNGCDVTEVHIEGLISLPHPPDVLILNGIEVKGHDAATYFTLPAILEVFLTVALKNESLGGYYFHLAEMRNRNSGVLVFLKGHRHEAGGSVLEFQAPDFKSIYDVLPDLLATFPHARAINWQKTIESLGQEDRTGVLDALIALENRTPHDAWQFAQRLVQAFPDFMDARVTSIRCNGNRIGMYEGFRIEICTDEDKLRELTQRIVPCPAPILIENGRITMVENQYNVTGNQIGAVGSNAQNNGDMYQEIWHQSEDSIDLAALASELFTLRGALQDLAIDADHYVAIGEVAQAAKSAQENDGPKALEHLKKAGAWVFDTASKVGIGLATAYAKTKLGL